MVLTLLTAQRAVAREAQNAGPVDTALIVSVDVSGSVDDGRYALQMDGIARALEDNAVIAAILGGRRASIFFTLVEWSERPAISIPWTRIASREDALALAAQVRRTPRQEGEFTCVAHMMKFVSDLVVTTKPAPAGRVVMDVSGDGIDNCDGEEATIANRDALVATGMTINGLPINEGDPSRPLGGGAFRAPGRPFEQRKFTGEIKTLEPWYEKHVIGGDGAFLLPANGYKDFRHAIRRKFVFEISGRRSPGNSRPNAERADFPGRSGRVSPELASTR
ncbi:MAG: DUF1194 domain-containing protein [Rhodoblastus sp.]|uniref:DUF1194 domain-containing protein n=1 Tax=Rhodoblastus sp. TaxID=1962975 RepID=UPI003F9DD76B